MIRFLEVFFVVMSKKDVQGKHIGLVKYMSRCVEE